MERVVDIIGPLKVRQGGPVGPQHMIRYFKEIKADGFRCLGPVADSHVICGHVAGRKKGADLETHGLPFVSSMAKRMWRRIGNSNAILPQYGRECTPWAAAVAGSHPCLTGGQRSEERRVGKECRS